MFVFKVDFFSYDLTDDDTVNSLALKAPPALCCSEPHKDNFDPAVKAS